jgi:transcriptional regulator with XRE-family HTH domain
VQPAQIACVALRVSPSPRYGKNTSTGIDWWSHTTVSEVERGRRSVSVDELVSLAIVLGVSPTDLLDPVGADGSRMTPFDAGRTSYRTLPAVVAHHWMRGAVRVSFPHGPDSPWIEPAPGRDDEFGECQRALSEWSSERAQRAREAYADEQEREREKKGQRDG